MILTIYPFCCCFVSFWRLALTPSVSWQAFDLKKAYSDYLTKIIFRPTILLITKILLFVRWMMDHIFGVVVKWWIYSIRINVTCEWFRVPYNIKYIIYQYRTLTFKSTCEWHKLWCLYWIIMIFICSFGSKKVLQHHNDSQHYTWYWWNYPQLSWLKIQKLVFYPVASGNMSNDYGLNSDSSFLHNPGCYNR